MSLTCKCSGEGCLKVVAGEMGKTTGQPRKSSGLKPAWMASVANRYRDGAPFEDSPHRRASLHSAHTSNRLTHPLTKSKSILMRKQNKVSPVVQSQNLVVRSPVHCARNAIQSVRQVFHEILRVLEADGDTHEPLVDPEFGALARRHRHVRHLRAAPMNAVELNSER